MKQWSGMGSNPQPAFFTSAKIPNAWEFAPLIWRTFGAQLCTKWLKIMRGYKRAYLKNPAISMVFGVYKKL